MATLATVLTSIRTATDQDETTGPISDTQLTAWVNEVYPALFRELADLIPDFFTTITADFTLAAGVSTVTTTTLGINTTLGKPRVLERKSGSGTAYMPLNYIRAYNAGWPARLGWRFLGGTTFHLLPPGSAPGTYRLQYLRKALTLAGTDAIDLPDGGDRVLIEDVAALVRPRLQQDPAPHLAARKRAWDLLVASLRPQHGSPQSIIDVTGRYE
jgi:hypothetical protein